MADESSTSGTSSNQVSGESSATTITINVKTLDSKIYTVVVDKDMLVQALKAKLADIVGVPIERQRLIYRGKVLKDDHLLSEYQFEDGHTLHLVARQPSEVHMEGNTQETGNNSQGNAAGAGAPRNRIPQSILLGTVNVGDQGEAMVPDIGRLVGAVLNSLGVNAAGPAAGQPSNNTPPPNAEAEGDHTTGSQMAGNVSISFQPPNQIPPFSSAFPNMNIPDSLTTLSEFIGRMEVALRNGTDSSSNNVHGTPTENQSSGARGLPTPDNLRVVIEQAQQLLRGSGTDALSRVSALLEREGNSTDMAIRREVQAEAMQVGRAMQHLGAMLLELGRTMLTLRMGPSPAESFVNSGPAVYISPSGPNPIMVQPVPSQPNSLFGISSLPPVFGGTGPIPRGDLPRNVSIQINAGSSGPGGQERSNPQVNRDSSSNDNNTNTDDSSSTRRNPSRTVVASFPSRPITQTSGNVLSVIYPVHVRSQLAVPISTSSDPIPIPPTTRGESIIAQISAQVASALAASGQEFNPSQTQSSTTNQGSQTFSGDITSSLAGQQTPSEPPSLQLGRNAMVDSTLPITSEAAGASMPTEENQVIPEGNSNKLATAEVPTTDGNLSAANSARGPSVEQHNSDHSNVGSFETESKSSSTNFDAQSNKSSDSNIPTPIGLGLGGLQPKKRGKTAKPIEKNKDNETIARGQQILQTLASQNPNTSRSSDPQTSLLGQLMNNIPTRPEGTNGQRVDAADMMSQILQAPAFSNLLTGVAENTGIGSPNDLKSMLEQCTQSPGIRNTLNDIAQQVGGEAPSGGLDFSRMIQQMMPAVSQALGGTMMNPAPHNNLQLSGGSRSDQFPESSQADLEHVAERIEQQDSPGNIFRLMLESAGNLLGDGNNTGDLVSSLGNNEDLANEFMRMFSGDLHRRVQKDSCQKD